MIMNCSDPKELKEVDRQFLRMDVESDGILSKKEIKVE